MFRFRTLASLLLILGAPKAATAGVLVVDDSGGFPFTSIQAAVTAASDGDTILVKTGTYGPFTIDDKTLTVVADLNAGVIVDGTIEVRNLAPSKIVVLTGLASEGHYGSTSSLSRLGLYLHGNAGAVRLQKCSVIGGIGLNDPGFCGCDSFFGACSGFTGARIVSNPGGVAFVKSTIRGGWSWGVEQCPCGNPVMEGGIGAEIEDTVVALYDCILTGGTGGGGCVLGGTGGLGCNLVTTSALTGLVASGTLLGGGGGGEGLFAPNAHGGAGGTALDAGPGTVVWLLDSPPLPGPGGSGPQPGAPGQASVGSGQVTTFTQPKLVLEINSPVREQMNFQVVVRGRPGDVVFLWKSLQTPFLPTASWHGVILALGSSIGLATNYFGTLPASGVLGRTYSFPDLGPTATELTWFFQAWRHSPIDGRTVGSMRAVTLLDSSY